MPGTNRTLGRSAGPQDVRPGWLLESAIRSLGPFIFYPDGTATDRKRSLETPDCVIWRPGDPADPPKRHDFGSSKQPHNVRRGL